MSATTLSRQHGFSLVAAMFLLVIIGTLGAFLVTFSSTQQRSAANDLQGARAYQAARAGIEWGAYKALRNASCAATSNVPVSGGLASFAVTVTCNALSADEGAGPGTVVIYQLRATACNQPSGGACPNAAPTNPDYVQRVVDATVGR